MPSSQLVGLTSAVAAERLAIDGPNVLPRDGRRNVLSIVVGIVREPMVLLLLAAAALYFAFGDVREALTLSVSVVIVVVLTVVQEGRTERALDALRDLSSPRARVVRDGEAVTVAAALLVRGDIVAIAEGDRVPADAILREGAMLTVDESLLTGESVPVMKRPSDGEARQLEPHAEDGAASLFSGSLVLSGRGLAEIVATGARSYLGRLGKSLGEAQRGSTPLEREVRSTVRRTAIIAVSLSLILVLAKGIQGSWLDATLSGITLAMSLLPEEFPVVLTVFLALGARRIGAHGVLTRRMAAVETLGAVHVLCTDKTGTLTQNKMTVARLSTLDAQVEVHEGAILDLPESVHALVEFGILASPRDPFDPMEKALHELGHRALERTEHLHPKWRAIREYPLTPELLAVTYVWKSTEREALVVATKGAPEAIFDLCHFESGEGEPWRRRAAEMTNSGLRVLAVAKSKGAVDRSPEQAHDVAFEMVGFLGLRDPIRKEVPESIALCRRAGVRVIMITGDHPDTARSVARAAGIEDVPPLTGKDIEMMDDDVLAARLLETTIVARAVPAHKLRIVQLLRARGLVVAMTGDGVNDAPALKAADVGVAMGARGTDVAREAASLVLENDSFDSIVSAIGIGRRIFDNLRKAFGYLVAVHVPIAGLSLAPALLGWPSVLLPAHVVFLELIIDPACSVVFEMEPAEPDVMDRAPRPVNTPLLTRRRFAWALLEGAVVFGAALYVLFDARSTGRSLGEQRALSFVALVVGNLALLVAARSGERPFRAAGLGGNSAVLVLGGATLLLTGLIVALAPLRAIFSFDACNAAELCRAAVVAAIPVLVFDSLKRRFRVS